MLGSRLASNRGDKKATLDASGGTSRSLLEMALPSKLTVCRFKPANVLIEGPAAKGPIGVFFFRSKLILPGG